MEIKDIFEGKTAGEKRVMLLNLFKDMAPEQIETTKEIGRYIIENDQDIDFQELSKIFISANLLKSNNVILEMNLENYKKHVEEYEVVLKNIIDLSNNLGFSTSLELCILYSYLLWSGYLSTDKTHTYKIEDRMNIQGLYSFDILKGSGVCLNYADMLCDLLSLAGYENNLLLNKMTDTIIKGYVPETIERNIVKPKKRTKSIIKVLEPMTKIVGNHAFNLIHDDGLYIYDPTNLIAFSLNNYKEAQLVSGIGTITLNPYTSFLLSKKRETKTIERLLWEKELNCPFTEEEYKETFIRTLEIIDQNKDLIEETYNKNKEYIQYIAENSKKQSFFELKKELKNYKNNSKK